MYLGTGDGFRRSTRRGRGLRSRGEPNDVGIGGGQIGLNRHYFAFFCALGAMGIQGNWVDTCRRANARSKAGRVLASSLPNRGGQVVAMCRRADLPTGWLAFVLRSSRGTGAVFCCVRDAGCVQPQTTLRAPNTFERQLGAPIRAKLAGVSASLPK